MTCGAGYPKALLDRGYSERVRCELSDGHAGPHECGMERWLRHPIVLGNDPGIEYVPLAPWLPQR